MHQINQRRRFITPHIAQAASIHRILRISCHPCAGEVLQLVEIAAHAASNNAHNNAG